MATILSHGVVAAALTRVYAGREKLPVTFWATTIGCSMLPDLDVVGLRYGVPYGSLLGHRGLSHSLLAAAVIASVATACWAYRFKKMKHSLFELWLILFLVTMSHGLLDALTNGGLGVAFFAPFNNHRYFFPFRPIQVSPIGLDRFWSPRGWIVLRNEMKWIWIPSAVLFVVAAVFSG